MQVIRLHKNCTHAHVVLLARRRRRRRRHRRGAVEPVRQRARRDAALREHVRDLLHERRRLFRRRRVARRRSSRAHAEEGGVGRLAVGPPEQEHARDGAERVARRELRRRDPRLLHDHHGPRLLRHVLLRVDHHRALVALALVGVQHVNVELRSARRQEDAAAAHALWAGAVVVRVTARRSPLRWEERRATPLGARRPRPRPRRRRRRCAQHN